MHPRASVLAPARRHPFLGRARDGEGWVGRRVFRGVNSRHGMFLARRQAGVTTGATTLIEFYCYLRRRPLLL